MSDLSILQTRLSEAEEALHKLMTGSKAETLEKGDNRVTYTKADAGQLRQYIIQLRCQISDAGGSPAPRRRAFVIDL